MMDQRWWNSNLVLNKHIWGIKELPRVSSSTWRLGCFILQQCCLLFCCCFLWEPPSGCLRPWAEMRRANWGMWGHVKLWIACYMIQNCVFLNIINAFTSQEPSAGNVWPCLSELHGMYTVTNNICCCQLGIHGSFSTTFPSAFKVLCTFLNVFVRSLLDSPRPHSFKNPVKQYYCEIILKCFLF